MWNIPNSPNKFDTNSVHQYYKNIELKDNFNLNLTTEGRFQKFCNLLTSQKQQELIQLRRFLKDGANILVKPIVKICNISISSGFFPNDCKIAKLKPLYKKGSKTNPQNFRPISLLPLISKVIERIAFCYSKIIFCTIINQDLGKTIPPTSLSSMTKY